jgi:hypothetical protein
MIEVKSYNSQISTEVHQSCFFEEAPDEIIQKIFFHCSFKELLALSAVSIRLQRIAGDSRLWKIFCQTFPNSPIPNRTHFPQREDETMNYRLLYYQMRAFSENIQHNRYSIKETYPEDSLFVSLSEDALCMLRSSMKIEIYNPENERLEQQLDPSPPNPTKLEKITHHLLIPLESLLVDYREKKINTLEAFAFAKDLIGQLLQFLDDQEVIFFFPLCQLLTSMQKFRQTDDADQALQVVEEALNHLPSQSLINFLELSKSHFFPLDPPYYNEKLQYLNPISCFVASKRYFAVAYITGYIDIWERVSANKICTFDRDIFPPQIDFSFVLNFLGNHIVILEKATNSFFKINLEDKTITNLIKVQKQKFAEKIDETQLLIANSKGDCFIIDAVYPQIKQAFQIISDKLTFLVLDPQNKERLALFDRTENGQDCVWLGSLNSINPFSCPIEIDSLLLAHGSAWMTSKEGIFRGDQLADGVKMSTIVPENQAMPLKSTLFCYHEKLFLHTYGKKLKVINFRTTEKEILLEIIQGLQQGQNPNFLARRLENLSPRHKDGILFCFHHIYNAYSNLEPPHSFRSITWKMASIESQIGAIQFYLENNPNILTIQTRQLHIEHAEASPAKRLRLI